MTQHIEFLRPIGAILLSAGLYVFRTIAEVSPPPDAAWMQWLDRYGLPVVMLALAIYGIIQLQREIRRVNDARISDKEEALKLYREDAKQGNESRTQLIIETANQTRAFRDLAEEIRKRPHP